MLRTARRSIAARGLICPILDCTTRVRTAAINQGRLEPSSAPGSIIPSARAQSTASESTASHQKTSTHDRAPPPSAMTKAKYTEFTPEEYPPFPDGLPTVELQTIPLEQLLNGNAAEQERVFDVCKGRGFFYLDLRGSETGDILLTGAERIARVGEEIFELPLGEKMKCQLGQGGRTLFGYKKVGATVTDREGTKDTAEFFNVGKNDMIVPDEQMKHAWPVPVLESKPLFREYIKTAHSIGMLLLGVLAERLGVDAAAITSQHRIEEPAGDHVRITRGPPRETEDMPEIQTPSHTDFGT